MADSIAEILGQRDFSESDEIHAIKDFVRRRWNSEVKVSIRGSQIIVSAPSAALAATLRLNLPELARRAGTDKKIIFRIG